MTSGPRTSTPTLAFVLAAIAAVGLAVFPAQAQKKGKAKALETYQARAMSLGGLGVGGPTMPSGAVVVDLSITRWSTEEERSALLEALASGGSAKLWSALGKMEPVGRIHPRQRLSYELRYAREVVRDGQRVVILATDRPILFWENVRNTRSRQYDISVIQLVLDEEGNGQGTAMPAVRVTLSEGKDEITLEDFTTQPVQLTRVKKRK